MIGIAAHASESLACARGPLEGVRQREQTVAVLGHAHSWWKRHALPLFAVADSREQSAHEPHEAEPDGGKGGLLASRLRTDVDREFGRRWRRWAAAARVAQQ